MTLSGSCLCGAVAYQSTDSLAVTAICHCDNCQKWSGGAFTSSAIVPKESFSVTKGSPKIYKAIGGSGNFNRHYFCDNCGSGLFTKLDIMGGQVVIKAGSLDDGSTNLGGRIENEFYCKDRVSYLSPLANAKQHERL
ncbi:hypothetical protein Forpi1262_v011189 [Fusarium oxysporum f. sp. raphani]|uniref:CENP-V/GFA domain-containing protein n=1 Tax=Fusarium oxysporum f. sp. raphani TaxID=96318 RepID=A0A8J5UK81_FUSOX|nr:hypothetical protein Forpi1262_v011189 [Fusarium oxysporum f. sp. raphani]